MRFALNSVGGVKIGEGGGGPYPLADLDRGFHFRQDTGGNQRMVTKVNLIDKLHNDHDLAN